MNETNVILTKSMTCEEVAMDSRFRSAVNAGEYTRAISVFLRIQYPETEDLSTLPRSVVYSAQVAVDNAFFDHAATRRAMAKEMR